MSIFVYDTLCSTVCLCTCRFCIVGEDHSVHLTMLVSLLLPVWAVIFYSAGSLHLLCRDFTHSLLLLHPQHMLSLCCGRRQCRFETVTLTGNCSVTVTRLIQSNSVGVCCFRPRAGYSHSHSHSQASVGSSAEERQSRPVSASHHAASRGNSQARPASSPQGRRGLSPAPSGQTLCCTQCTTCRADCTGTVSCKWCLCILFVLSKSKA